MKMTRDANDIACEEGVDALREWFDSAPIITMAMNGQHPPDPLCAAHSPTPINWGKVHMEGTWVKDILAKFPNVERKKIDRWLAINLNHSPDLTRDEVDAYLSQTLAEHPDLFQETVHFDAVFRPNGDEVVVDPDAPVLSLCDRPAIEVVPGEHHITATLGEEAIIKAGAEIYQRGGKLVRPILQEVEASHGRRTNAVQLLEVRETYMRDRLSRVAKFHKVNKTDGKVVPINAPYDVGRTILARQGEWKFPVVLGAITTPTLRPDGTILSRAGYDPATQFLLVAPPPMPSIPDEPSREDAVQALALLKELLSEFPCSGAYLSVALSILITPVVRGAFDVAPLHATRSPTAGTGKSFLNDIAAYISMGHPCPVMAKGANEEELEKRIGSALLAGLQIISIDNVNGELGGDQLCQIVSQPLINIRVLGRSEIVRIENRGTTIFATGNNLMLKGDMTRRTILCELDAMQERPELRKFKRQPDELVMTDRGKYIAACLTIVRAYFVAGRPGRAEPFGTFQQWSDSVRSALMWLGCEDPYDTAEQIRADDPEARTRADIFCGLKDAFGTGQAAKKNAAEIIAESAKSESDCELRWPSLREGVVDAAGASGKIDTRVLSHWLRRNKGRIQDGLRLESVKVGRTLKWFVHTLGE